MDLGFEDEVALVEERMRAIADGVEPSYLGDAVAHVALAGGKRLRPILTLLSCEAVGGDRADAVDVAAGVELVHTSALVADDVIDRSAVRRGVPTVHEEWDHDTAVLASNQLLGRALETIDDREQVRSMVDALEALGEGEAMELAGAVETVDDYDALAHRKTAALFVTACDVGGIAGGASQTERDALRRYGEHLGVGFQIRDDVLDYTGTQDDLGKPVGRDELLDRPSLVALHSREEDARLVDSVAFARDRARDRVDRARAALDDLPESEATAALRDVTSFVVDRNR